METYYKVVKVKGDDLVSAVVQLEFPDFYRYYKKDGEIQKVKHGMVFDSVDDAVDFMNRECMYYLFFQLWECTGRPIGLPRAFVQIGGWSAWKVSEMIDDIRKVLRYGAKNYGKAQGLIAPSARFPYGTVRVRDLKLIKRIK